MTQERVLMGVVQCIADVRPLPVRPQSQVFGTYVQSKLPSQA